MTKNKQSTSAPWQPSGVDTSAALVWPSRLPPSPAPRRLNKGCCWITLPWPTIASVAAVVIDSTLLAEFLGFIKSIFHQT